MKMKLAFVRVGFALALIGGMSGPAIAGDERPASGAPTTERAPSAFVSVSFAVNTLDVGSKPSGTAGGTLLVGQSMAIGVQAGRPGDADPCRATGIGAAEGVAQSAFFAWRVEVRPVAINGETVTLAVDWKRNEEQPGGAHSVVAGDRRTISLTEGDRHVLDFVAVRPGAKSNCANLLVQVEAKVADDPAVADKRLGYDVWLVDQDAAGHEVTRRLQTVSGQGETVPFRFFPFGWTSDGSAPSDPWSADVAVDISGTIKGRLHADGTVQMVVNMSRAVQSGRQTGSTGYGEKRFTAKVGETVRLDIPQSGTSMAPVLAGHRTSLTITVHSR